MKHEADTLATVIRLIDGIDIAMLTTIDADGRMKSRPLKTQEEMFHGDLWFMVSLRSDKVTEIAANHHVNLAYASRERNVYVSISGTASIERDQNKIDLLWNDALKAFFPKGKDDPEIGLIRVRMESAEYWDGPSTLVGKMLAFIAARISGNPAAMGKHETIDR